MKLDMHFHSKLSDGRKTSEEIIDLAIKRKIGFLACTEHDIINTEFPIIAARFGIKSCEAVEISWTDTKHSQHLHLTCYSKSFSQKTHKILEDSRLGRQRKMILQIELLKNNWFDIEWNSFLEYFKKKWVNIDNFNSSHLSTYVFKNSNNIELLTKLTWEKLDRDLFIKYCLKEEWKYSWIWSVAIPEYEPSLELCGEVAKEDKAILSLAHPNFKLTQEQFIERIWYYMECGINAVEINSKATKDWVHLILKYQKKFNYLLTFWSDSHFKEHDDNEHWSFWKMNRFVNEDIISINLYMLQKKLNLIINNQ